jgi:hypothetical protein
MVQGLIQKHVQGIRETKFKVFGAVWSVFDWTMAIIIVASVFFALGFTFLFCLCFSSTAEYEEEQLQEEINIMRKKANLEKLLATTEGNNLSGALLKAGSNTKGNERKPMDAKLVMAMMVDINAIMNGADIE